MKSTCRNCNWIPISYFYKNKLKKMIVRSNVRISKVLYRKVRENINI